MRYVPIVMCSDYAKVGMRRCRRADCGAVMQPLPHYSEQQNLHSVKTKM